MRANQGCVIKRCHNCLARASCGDKQIPVPVVPITLHHQVLEHPPLMRMRDDVESCEGLADTGLTTAALASQRVLKPIEITAGDELLKSVVTPVGVERRAHALDDGSRLRLCKPHVPFKARVHRRSRQVRRTHECG